MSNEERLSSPGASGRSTQRPAHTSSASGYFAYRPVSPPAGRRTGTNTMASDQRLSPGAAGSREHRSQSLSDSIQGRMSRRNTYDEHDIDRDSVGFSEAEEEGTATRATREDGTGQNQDEDEDSPSPTPDEMEAIRASREFNEDDPLTLKDRQSLLNAEHPFGLPLWKPALYKKTRTVTRNAETALHNVPGATARHLNFGNILWTILYGWWLALVCTLLSLPLWVLEYLADPKKRHASVLFGLGWYLFFPFDKYVEGDLELLGRHYSPGEDSSSDAEDRDEGDDTPTVSPRTRANRESQSTIRSPRRNESYMTSSSESWMPNERTSLAASSSYRSYGAAPFHSFASLTRGKIPGPSSQFGSWIANGFFWIFLVLIVTPLMVLTSAACWAMIFAIPMAKLNWELLAHLFTHPLALRFREAPPPLLIPQPTREDGNGVATGSGFTIKRTRIAIGNPAPSGRPCSTVLLCVYKAMGFQYYKYTVGGVNILFVNTLPVVFLVILDGFFLLPWVERQEEHGRHVSVLLAGLANRGFIFVCSLTSVIPLSYFIGMAVASISAQSSIGMGAVINATFGSIIEIILYSIALTQSKGALVEGSIVGSILAGVLLMQGLSMISSALKKKESKFNARSASVTSTMLVMAMIGTLAPTIFYQTYGNFELHCDGCPTPYPIGAGNGSQPEQMNPWTCHHCSYEHVDPVGDAFYQRTVKPFMYFCTSILLLSYLIGLWFSLRTHASQIWSNPQKLLQPLETPARGSSIHQRLFSAQQGHSLPTHMSPTTAAHGQEQSKSGLRRKDSRASRTSLKSLNSGRATPTQEQFSRGPSLTRRASQGPPGIMKTAATPYTASLYAPIIESVDQAVRSTNAGSDVLTLPQHVSTEEFARAVTVATVSALRHPQTISASSPGRGLSNRGMGGQMHGQAQHELEASGADAHGHGGPSWSRQTSASVLLCCTVLYALIAEILVDVVDVVLEGSGIQEKFLGITLFALVPNTTEFMNAMSFAMNGNISLSMEIGSAYALQVCLLQIPAMVAFSAWWDPQRMGGAIDTFTLIFPRWDVIVIILAIFLLTYTYIEAKSNYHRGSILILSYLVLVAGFFFAPPHDVEEEIIKFSVPEGSPSQFLAKTVISSLWSR